MNVYANNLLWRNSPLQKVTVAELKKRIQNRTGIAPEDQRLIYGGKQLRDECKLGDYCPLGNGSSITLVMRLPGGGNFWGGTRSTSERYKVRHIDPSLLANSDEACIITLEKGNCVCMPCRGRHSISPDGLMDYCWSEISNNGKSEIRCPVCDEEWTLEVIYHRGTTAEELRWLEEGLSKNVCLKNPDISECPGCQSLCERKDKNNNCVQCSICSKQSSYFFCWQCNRQWKNSITDSKCGNPDCDRTLEVLRRLAEAPVKTIIGISVPSMRACPRCFSLVEHCDDGCKQVTCKKCYTRFCFICLRMKSQGSWSCGGCFDKCVTAPRQTRIPAQ